MIKQLFKETFIYGLGAVLPRLVNLVFIRLFAEHLGRAQFAAYADLFANTALILAFASFGLETAFFRFSTDYKKEKVFSTAYTLHMVFAFIMMLIVAFKFNFISEIAGYKEHPEYIILVGIIVCLDLLCVLPYAWLRATNQAKKFSLIKIVNSLLFSGAVLSMFLILPALKVDLSFLKTDKPGMILYATALAGVATLFVLSPIILKSKFKFDKVIFKKMIYFGLPVMVAGLSYILNENFDKIYLKRNIDAEIAGAYAACYKIAVVMVIFATAFRMGIEPFFFKQAKKSNAKQSYAKILWCYVFLGCLIIVGVMANLDWISLLLLKNKEYFIALNIVPIILVAMLFSGVYQNLSVWYKVTDKTYFGMIFSIIGAFITISSIVYFTPIYGYITAAWATLAAYLLMSIISYIVSRYYYPVIYNVVNLLLMITLCVISLIFMDKIDSFIVKNIILLLYLVIILAINRKEILKLLQKKLTEKI